MKVLTGVDVMVLYISSTITTEKSSMITFIADKNNIVAAVQPMIRNILHQIKAAPKHVTAQN